jgi:hypothetical protein
VIKVVDRIAQERGSIETPKFNQPYTTMVSKLNSKSFTHMPAHSSSYVQPTKVCSFDDSDSSLERDIVQISNPLIRKLEN